MHLFFYLPSTTDCSHAINQFRENFFLHPIDSLHMKILDSIQKREDFMPVDLGSRNLEFVQRFFKEAVEFSHSNIVRNANNL